MARTTKNRSATVKKSPKLQGIKKNSRRSAHQSIKAPHMDLRRNGRNSRRKRDSVVKSFVNAREVMCSKGNGITITCDLSGEQHPRQTEAPRKSYDATLTKRVRPKAKHDQTLNSMFLTLDMTEANDVIVINDDDNDVICIDEQLPPNRKQGSRQSDSIILIDDDSVIEVLPTDNDNNKNKNIAVPKKKPITSSRGIQFHDPKINGIQASVAPNKRGINQPPSVSRLSPISTRNRQQPGFHGCATSTPNRTVTDTPRIPNLLQNLSRVARCRIPSPIPSVRRLRSRILTNQIREICTTTNINDFGPNFLNGAPVRNYGLRPVFIDGSNIAMGHSKGKFFSVEGLKICIQYFKRRRHEVTAIVPLFRKKRNQSSNAKMLQHLENQGTVIFSPSRTINGRHIVPYDDRYIALLAHVHKGIIVSSDNYRDLLEENPELLETIENRLLIPTWVRDMIIFPEDPMGRNGPKLEEFLKFP